MSIATKITRSSRRESSVTRTVPHKHRQTSSASEPYARKPSPDLNTKTTKNTSTNTTTTTTKNNTTNTTSSTKTTSTNNPKSPSSGRSTRRKSSTTRLPSPGPSLEDSTAESHVSSYLYGDDSRSLILSPTAASPPTNSTNAPTKPRNRFLSPPIDPADPASPIDHTLSYRGAPLTPIGDFTYLDPASLSTLGWSLSEVRLFDNIRRRAMLPLFPLTWVRVFPGLPKRLFPSTPTEPALLDYRLSPQRAVMIMERLMKAGAEVRARTPRGRQSFLSRLVKAVYSWAFYEADVKPPGAPRCWHFFASSDAIKLERVSNKRMRNTARAAREYRAGLFEGMDILEMSKEEMDAVPEGMTVYGVAVCGAKVALMTLNSEDEGEGGDGEGEVKTHIVCDFEDPGMDVWNAASVALHAVQLRDEVVGWREYRVQRAEREERACSVVSFAREEKE